MGFINWYEDARRADAYESLELANTYYLAYRDLPAIISDYVAGTRALDFGCGTGRSSRFLKELGFSVVGVGSHN
jgi:SAM-dependent methyltransferase